MYDSCGPAIAQSIKFLTTNATDEQVDYVFQVKTKEARETIAKNLNAVAAECKGKTEKQIIHCTDPDKECQEGHTSVYFKVGEKHTDMHLCQVTMSWMDYPHHDACNERYIFNQPAFMALITAINPRGTNFNPKDEVLTKNGVSLAFWVYLYGRLGCSEGGVSDIKPKGEFWTREEMTKTIPGKLPF